MLVWGCAGLEFGVGGALVGARVLMETFDLGQIGMSHEW